MAIMILGAAFILVGFIMQFSGLSKPFGWVFIAVGLFLLFYDFDSDTTDTKTRSGKRSKKSSFSKKRGDSSTNSLSDESYSSSFIAWLWEKEDYSKTNDSNSDSSHSSYSGDSWWDSWGSGDGGGDFGGGDGGGD